MAVELLAELRALGVVLSIDGDGRLAYDAPAGVLGDDLMARMRAERDGLLALVERFEERAAIAEFDGRLTREDAEALAWESIEPRGPEYLPPMTGVSCPWCGCGERLLEHSEGLRCDGCGRDAWRFEDEAIVRCDWVELVELSDRPRAKQDEP